MDKDEGRNELLLKMYDQMFNDINRHILVIWQSIGVIIGAFAFFSLAEKEIISVDIAVTLITLLCGWMLAQLYDASYWYNRNLAIISNIEREFLSKEDLSRIHYYFGQHRGNKMIFHLRIQKYLAFGLLLVLFTYHFCLRIYPGFALPLNKFDAIRALPYIFLVIMFPVINYVRNDRNDAYKEFLKYSPGKEIDAGEIKFGPGHGGPKTWMRILRQAFQYRKY